MNARFLERTLSVFEFLSAYHHHRVIGLGNIPKEGPALIVTNHSLATYDNFLLAGAIYLHCGRVCRSLGDRQIFKTPWLRRLANSLTMEEGSPATGNRLLRDGHLLIISPGGMRESLRPSTERYQIRWDNRLGFIRLAINTKAPILLAACPSADDLYHVYKSSITSFFYKRFKLPLPIARGIGLTIIPRPIPLQHYISLPLYPPSTNGGVENFHASIIREMEKLMGSTKREEKQLRSIPMNR